MQGWAPGSCLYGLSSRQWRLGRCLSHPGRPMFQPHAVADTHPTPAAAAAAVKALSSKRTAPPHNPADMEGSPFHELGLQEVMDGMGRVRVRQHVNPLRAEFQVPAPPPDWASIYQDPTLPLVLDMGCGPGRFLLLLQRRMEEQRMQRQQQQEGAEHMGPTTTTTTTTSSSSSSDAPQDVGHHLLLGQPCNFLGIEIRAPLVDRANKWAARLGCQHRVHYLYANATVSLATLLGTYPGPLVRVAVQFPDPHFKKRHHKRRIIQPAVVDCLKQLMPVGGDVFLQSDVYEAATAMRDAFEQQGSEAFGLHPLHQQAAVFQWTDQDQLAAKQAAAAAAAAAGGGGGGEDPSAASTPHVASDEGEASTDSSRSSAEEEEEEGGSSAGQEVFVSQWAAGGWLVDNPLGVPTEREHYVQQQGGPVYRVLLTKVEQ